MLWLINMPLNVCFRSVLLAWGAKKEYIFIPYVPHASKTLSPTASSFETYLKFKCTYSLRFSAYQSGARIIIPNVRRVKWTITTDAVGKGATHRNNHHKSIVPRGAIRRW